MSGAPRLVLASSSPRRQQLLTQLGLTFEIQPADIDETPKPAEDPVAYVRRLAVTKATTVSNRHGATGVVVIAADTTVVLDGEILAKPADPADAIKMLSRLSGREHQTHTGVAVVRDAQHEDLAAASHSIVVTTYVQFATLTDEQIAWYVSTGEPLDKAGAYAIQGIGAVFVQAVAGSVSNVVGLPLAETAELLRSVGVSVCE